jgi:hypothetical protein
MSNNDLVSREEIKVNQILTLIQNTPQLDDLMYAREIIDLMNHFRSHYSHSSTTNLLLFLTLLHQSDPNLQEYSQVSHLNPVDQQSLNSILSKILK